MIGERRAAARRLRDPAAASTIRVQTKPMEEGMKKSTITRGQAEGWLKAMTARKPKPGLDIFRADAAFVIPAAEGIVLQIVRDNGERANLFLNAVVANGVLQTIRMAGQDEGWLDAAQVISVSGSSGPEAWQPHL